MDMPPGSSIGTVEISLAKGDKCLSSKTVNHLFGRDVEGKALGTSSGPLAQV